MKILWHAPTSRSFYADYFINISYKAAFERAGHEFRFLSPEDRFKEVFESFQPDIFVTNTHDAYYRGIDFDVLAKARAGGTKAFVMAEAMEYDKDYGLSKFPEKVERIREGKFGDVYFAYVEPERMRSFEEATGYEYNCVPLAADITTHYPVSPDPRYASDCVYVGNFLPNKKAKFERILYPLRKTCRLRIEGTNWTLADKLHSRLARAFPFIPRQMKFPIEAEKLIYSSSKIGLNIHEEQQGNESLDVNERTFKVPACGCMELSDWNKCILRYFSKDEVIVTENEKDWFEKIRYYLDNDEERKKIAAKGLARVKKEHTYDHRVKKLLSLYGSVKNKS